ncbi:MAG: precorrin-6Y C5,15-methyltransferase (decarboxylating) subunit CbiT [Methanobacteriaceae archaeon]|jgi:cobalt-precorrin-6B (C15)-methyltransferase|nr:precorrin-6Y C5,15-methyltransferase (decarboxylating) subunit CbiT [Methanobacteriaceae archaeon]MDO9626368.1 precorrin-6Y C5,15-methyltransferase (decarboxylating) subunit CbiT [Methanobacteriaceae archaeon]
MFRDSDFKTKKDVPGPTKEEIRCLVICKSKVKKDDTVVEIGCGTGGLTLEFTKRSKQVYSIDKNPKAVKLTRENLLKHELLDNVKLFEDDALSVLNSIPKFDILMIGGSGGDLYSIIEKASTKLNPGGRIIVTAILMETKTQSISKLKELGFEVEIIEVNISKGRIIDRGTMMFSQNPIAIIYTI